MHAAILSGSIVNALPNQQNNRSRRGDEETAEAAGAAEAAELALATCRKTLVISPTLIRTVCDATMEMITS